VFNGPEAAVADAVEVAACLAGDLACAAELPRIGSGLIGRVDGENQSCAAPNLGLPASRQHTPAQITPQHAQRFIGVSPVSVQGALLARQT
jgi:hypothetical protein